MPWESIALTDGVSQKQRRDQECSVLTEILMRRIHSVVFTLVR